MPDHLRGRIVVGVACLALLAGGCRDATPLGNALQPPFGSWISWGRPNSLGEEWVLLIAYLHNISTAPITLRSVDIRGPGVGPVVQVLRVEVAPLPGDPNSSFDWVPGGLYVTYPPSFQVRGETRCNVQTLRAVDGYVLEPDAEARILVLLRAVRAGTYNIDEHVVTYEQGRATYQQLLPVGMRGTVADGGRPLRPQKGERECVGETSLLPTGGTG